MSKSLSLLDPDFRSQVRAYFEYIQAAGIRPVVTSTRRSAAEQEALYLRYQRGLSQLPALPPGFSKHQCGRAVDVVFQPREYHQAVAELAPYFGIRWAGPRDYVHFETPEKCEAVRGWERGLSLFFRSLSYLSPYTALLDLGTIALSADEAAELAVDLGLYD